MIFTELRFLLFFSIVFACHWALRGVVARKLLLLAASYGFYAAWDPRFLALILASTVVDFLIGLRLGDDRPPTARRALLALSLALNLGLLAIFKYFNFFSTSLGALLTTLGLETSPASLDLILPVGISFYTFQTLSYTIDRYRGNLAAERSLLDFALFVGFFPQLVAGPIVRAAEFLPQLKHKPEFWSVSWRAALVLFAFGYAKKALIADRVAAYVDPAFAAAPELGALLLWLAAALYFVQIYCDFSGYSDMAIACAALLGYRLPLNFAFPIFARSTTQFWRRWHISLSSWFRDYLYIPLGGNRRGPARTYLNLCLVFLLCGLWHGAAWTFVIWGALHGAALVLERATGLAPRLEGSPLGLVWTLLLATCAWVFFRAGDPAQASDFLAGMFGAGSGSRVLDGWAPAAWAGGLFLGFHALNARLGLEARLARVPDLPFALGYGATWALLLPFSASGYQPFIYFQF